MSLLLSVFIGSGISFGYSFLGPLSNILNCYKISSLAESTSVKVVFNEVLATAGRDIVTKDISRLRGGWPMQDAFYVSLMWLSLVARYGQIFILLIVQ